MSPHRVCSECGGPLGGNPKQITCGSDCRSKRSRRLAKEARRKKRGRRPDETGFLALTPSNPTVTEITDVARDVMREELRPVVRESITEDALRAIQKLIALTPEMVDKLATDLRSDDDVVRQKAYTLGLRYSIGHAAIVTPPDAKESGNNLTVIFDGMTRPGEAVAADAEPIEEETRICNGCGQSKAVAQFVGHSDRCLECHEALRSRAEALLSGADAQPVQHDAQNPHNAEAQRHGEDPVRLPVDPELRSPFHTGQSS